MRKIVQVAVEPGWWYDDLATRMRVVSRGAVTALCDDGTLWRLQFATPGTRVEWEPYLPIPQEPVAPSWVHPDPSRAQHEVTERSQDAAGGEQLKADAAKS